MYKYLRLASVSLEEVFSILDENNFIGDSSDAIDFNFSEKVHFENVSFGYNTAKTIRNQSENR